MDKEKIIKYFLEKGFLLSPEACEEISKNPGLLNEVKAKSLVITNPGISRPIKILKNFTKFTGKIHLNDLVDLYNQRFVFLKNIIEKKLETEKIVSINNISNYTTVNVIGMVRDVEGNKIKIEDQTGNIFVNFEDNYNIVEDEVIGVLGKVANNMIFGEKIFRPDIPINKEVATSIEEKKCFFISGTQKTEKLKEFIRENSVDIIFTSSSFPIPEQIKSQIIIIPEESPPHQAIPIKHEHVFSLGNPSMVEAYGVKILLFYPGVVSHPEDLNYILKRRHLAPDKKIFLKEDPFLIDQIPDIIHVHLKETEIKNYKGVTIISTNNEKGVLVDLKTREAEIHSL